MPETWQSDNGENDSCSTYSADLSRPTSNHHNSLFVERLDRRELSDGNSRRGISVILDDTNLTVPRTPSDLNSSIDDRSLQLGITDRSDTTDRSIDHSSHKDESEGNEDVEDRSIKNSDQQVEGTKRPLSHGSEENSPSGSHDRQKIPESSNGLQIYPLSESSNILNDTSYVTVNENIEETVEDSTQQRYEDASSGEETDHEDSNETRQTVSTSILLSGRVSLPTEYAPIEPTSSREMSPALNIDQRVEELENEARESIGSISLESVAHNMKSSRGESILSHEGSSSTRPMPRSVSLLNNILIPVAPPNTAKEIPVLRSVGSPRLIQKEMHDHEHPEGHEKLQEQEHTQPKGDGEKNEAEPSEHRPCVPHELETKPEPVRPIERVVRRSEGLTYSQVDMALETLKQFQDELRSKAGIRKASGTSSSNDHIEYNDEKEHEPEAMPPQRVDSNSIDSKTPRGYWRKFSLWRILFVVLSCMIVPPFFFIIAAGQRLGFSDYRIITLITHSSYRAKLWKGFLWDIDVKWFRYFCLLSGIVETLGIFAGIAVGFGVGLTE